jgi:hypothetical protein
MWPLIVLAPSDTAADDWKVKQERKSKEFNNVIFAEI